MKQRISALGIALVVLAGCRDAGPAPVTVQLTHMRPQNVQGVFLNEAVELYFSTEVDRASVTSKSFQIVAADGTPARGERTVNGREVRFIPDPVLTKSLTDGGYKPGALYRVTVYGFPRIDCIRGVNGEPLDSSFEMTFRTVELGTEGTLFDDASPDRGSRTLHMRKVGVIGPDDPIVIECHEPLDPRTLSANDWQLTLGEYEVPLEARLIENWEEGSRSPGEACAKIELIPLEPLLSGESYELQQLGDISLRDFGGNRVARIEFSRLPDLDRISVRAGLEGGYQLLSFLDSGLANLTEVPGVDGLAHWSNTGRVGVRFPAAAGSGEDGAQLLAGSETRADIHATHLTIEEDTTCSLEPVGRIAILRSQGRMEISGELVRRAGSQPVRPLAHEDDLFPLGEDLSDWLARAIAEDQEWTILISGGDVVVRGKIDVDTPLLIVAGGMIRAYGSVQSQPLQLWLMGTGGSVQLDQDGSRVDNLVMDAPETNPLKEPLIFAVLSSPVPDRLVREVRGLRGRAGGRAGLGSWDVRYLPEEPPYLTENAVSHPRLLEGNRPVLLLIELEVGPGLSWDPPYVDYVHLTWEQK